MLKQRPTPAMMSAQAARQLPRWALLGLLALFILPILLTNDLWTLREATAFGIAHTMSQGSLIDWLLPNVMGQAVHDVGPLTGWVSAGIMRLLDTSQAVLATHIAVIFWFSITTASLWYGTWHLARRPEAQPIAFAFGGEASPRDYSRVVADSAVLLFIATFGIVLRQHEAVPDTALLSMASVAFYGLTWQLKRPYIGAALTGFATGAAILASTLFAGIWLLTSALVVNALLPSIPGKRDWRLSILCASALFTCSLWPLIAFLTNADAASAWFTLWGQHQANFLGFIRLTTLSWLTSNILWYLCPIWPLTLWGLYAWRHQLDLTHLYLPLILICTSLLATIFAGRSSDSVLLVFLPALSVFSAFALITVRRSLENFLDWFSISVFSLAQVVLWAYWIAWLTNFAPKMAKSVNMLAPGLTPSIDFAMLVCALASLAWLILVGWRMTRRPVVAWRGPWLAAAGMTATVIGTVGLFHNAIDLNRSYAPIAYETADILKNAGITNTDCVQTHAMVPGIRALFAFYGQIPFAKDNAQVCRFTVNRMSKQDELPPNMLGYPMSRPHTNEIFIVTAGHKKSSANDI